MAAQKDKCNSRSKVEDRRRELTLNPEVGSSSLTVVVVVFSSPLPEKGRKSGDF